MKPEDCPKLNECYKVKMILDKDLLDFQYAEAIRAVCANCSEGQRGGRRLKVKSGVVMKLGTRVFELYKGKYGSLPELAQAMGISGGHIYKVRQGKSDINQKFIIGAIKAFPRYKLDDLFYAVPEESQNDCN